MTPVSAALINPFVYCPILSIVQGWIIDKELLVWTQVSNVVRWIK